MHVYSKHRDVKLQLEIMGFGMKGSMTIIFIPAFLLGSYNGLIFRYGTLWIGVLTLTIIIRRDGLVI